MNIVIYCLLALLSALPLSTYASGQHKVSHSQQPAVNSQLINNILLVENARVKSTIPGVKVSAGYFKLTNNSQQTLRFTAVKTAAAKATEFHTMVMQNSKMAMRKVDTIEIKAQQTFVFKKNSYHVMFMGLKHAFKAGDMLPLTLIDENGKSYDLQMPIVEMQTH